MPPCRIFVVEADARCLLRVTEILKVFGCHFKRNTTGADVLPQAIAFKPDVILMAARLPEADTSAICEALTENDQTNHIPIIALTTADHSPASTHFTDTLTKPFTESAFQEVVLQQVTLQPDV